MFALGPVNAKQRTLKRTAAQGWSVPIAEIWRTSLTTAVEPLAIIELVGDGSCPKADGCLASEEIGRRLLAIVPGRYSSTD
jgi:hypothetical protein